MQYRFTQTILHSHKIKNHVKWPEIDILFAPHHGRDSGKVPNDVLKKLNPSVIVIGEAPAENLNYYEGYNSSLQLFEQINIT